MLDPNLSENEKNVQVEKFSQEYMAKLQKWVQILKNVYLTIAIKFYRSSIIEHFKQY